MDSKEFDFLKRNSNEILEKMSDRYYKIFPDMSSTFNWVISLATVLISYFINNLSGIKNSLNTSFILISVLCFFLMVINFLLFKLTFINLRTKLSIHFSNSELNDWLKRIIKDNNKNLIDELNSQELISDEFNKLKIKFDLIDRTFIIGICVSLFALLIFPTYFLIKYFSS